jgi:hypothetical protein
MPKGYRVRSPPLSARVELPMHRLAAWWGCSQCLSRRETWAAPRVQNAGVVAAHPGGDETTKAANAEPSASTPNAERPNASPLIRERCSLV